MTAVDPRPVLALDTATRFLSLALWSARDGVLARLEPEVGRDHAARLVPELGALFRAAGLPWPGDDTAVAPPSSATLSAAAAPVRAVVVGTGPGSYTGLRVGGATARGLARGWGVPVVGGDTLAALAATLEPVAAPLPARDRDASGSPTNDAPVVWGVIDARRGNVYAGRYRLLGPRIETVAAPAKIPRDDLPSEARIAEDVAPSAVALARMADEAHPIEPLYL